MSEKDEHNRHFFHSFPRPKAGEEAAATLKRGLSILASMKNTGLVLAPEIVEWDLNAIAGKNEQLRLLQRRVSVGTRQVEQRKVKGRGRLDRNDPKLKRLSALRPVRHPHFQFKVVALAGR